MKAQVKPRLYTAEEVLEIVRRALDTPRPTAAAPVTAGPERCPDCGSPLVESKLGNGLYCKPCYIEWKNSR